MKFVIVVLSIFTIFSTFYNQESNGLFQEVIKSKMAAKSNTQVQTQTATKKQQQPTPIPPTKEIPVPAKESVNGYSTSIASLLGAIQNSSFKYLSLEPDQCQNRASCDFGFMFYQKLGFLQNWLLRTSVRHMVDPANVYAQSWVEGMLGRNCSTIYLNCQQSPLDSLRGLAFLQRFVL